MALDKIYRTQRLLFDSPKRLIWHFQVPELPLLFSLFLIYLPNSTQKYKMEMTLVLQLIQETYHLTFSPSIDPGDQTRRALYSFDPGDLTLYLLIAVL